MMMMMMMMMTTLHTLLLHRALMFMHGLMPGGPQDFGYGVNATLPLEANKFLKF